MTKLYLFLKISAIIVGFLILSKLAIANNIIDTNATVLEINNYICSPGYNKSLLIPHDKTEFPLINQNPFAFYLFSNKLKQKDISKIKIETLKKDKSFFCHALPLHFIDGFTLATDIYTMDDLDLAEKKDDIISQLQKCHLRYRAEYNKLLKKDFIFLSRRSAKWSKLKGYEQFWDDKQMAWTTVKVLSQRKDFYCFNPVKKSDYNIDKRTLKVKLFAADRDKTEWERDYITRYRLNSDIDIPMTIKQAKKLFAKSDQALYYTYVTIKPTAHQLFNVSKVNKIFRTGKPYRDILNIELILKEKKKIIGTGKNKKTKTYWDWDSKVIYEESEETSKIIEKERQNKLEQLQALYNEGQFLAAFKFSNSQLNTDYKDLSIFLKNYLKNDGAVNADQAQYLLAEYYFNKKKYSKAAKEYQVFLSTYPQSDKTKTSLLKKGIAYRREGKIESASKVFQKVVESYPNSEEAKIAKEEDKIKFIIPPLSSISNSSQKSDFGKEASLFLEELLSKQEKFKVLKDSPLPSGLKREIITMNNIEFKKWKKTGADILIAGGFEYSPKKVTIELRLFDTFSEKRYLIKRYQGRPKDWKKLVDRFHKDVVHLILGIRL
jgi:tetratricopeptide (TPR) repeat protein